MGHGMLLQVSGANKLKLFLAPTMIGRRKKFCVLEALKTTDWRSNIGDKKNFRSGFSLCIGLYVDKMEVSIFLPAGHNSR